MMVATAPGMSLALLGLVALDDQDVLARVGDADVAEGLVGNETMRRVSPGVLGWYQRETVTTPRSVRWVRKACQASVV